MQSSNGDSRNRPTMVSVIGSCATKWVRIDIDILFACSFSGFHFSIQTLIQILIVCFVIDFHPKTKRKLFFKCLQCHEKRNKRKCWRKEKREKGEKLEFRLAIRKKLFYHFVFNWVSLEAGGALGKLLGRSWKRFSFSQRALGGD